MHNYTNTQLGKALDTFDDEDRFDAAKPEEAEEAEELDEHEGPLSAELLVCDSSEFRCPNEQKCISQSAICDNNRDCWDGADETNCDLTHHKVPEAGLHHENDEMSGDHMPESECERVLVLLCPPILFFCNSIILC